MKAVILAAGFGSRLGSLTKATPKCLIKVNGRRLLDNALECLYQNGIEEVIIVIGYLAEKVKDYLGYQYRSMRLTYVTNKEFHRTNSLYSLWLASEHFNDDTLLLEGDLFFEESIIKKICQSHNPNIMVVDDYQPFRQSNAVIIDENGYVKHMVTEKDQAEGFDFTGKLITANMYRFCREFMHEYLVPALKAPLQQNNIDELYDTALSEVVNSQSVPILAVSVSGLRWYEIDTPEDLQRAEELFQDR